MDDMEARNKAIEAYYNARLNLTGREYVNIVIDAYLGYIEMLERNKEEIITRQWGDLSVREIIEFFEAQKQSNKHPSTADNRTKRKL